MDAHTLCFHPLKSPLFSPFENREGRERERERSRKRGVEGNGVSFLYYSLAGFGEESKWRRCLL